MFQLDRQFVVIYNNTSSPQLTSYNKTIPEKMHKLTFYKVSKKVQTVTIKILDRKILSDYYFVTDEIQSLFFQQTAEALTSFLMASMSRVFSWSNDRLIRALLFFSSSGLLLYNAQNNRSTSLKPTARQWRIKDIVMRA